MQMSTWFNPAVWKAALRITRANAKEQYRSVLFWVLTVGLAIFLALMSNWHIHQNPSPQQALATISKIVLLPAIYVGIGILGIQYNEIVDGKVMRIRLLPNGVHIYGLTLLALIIPIFGPLLVAGVLATLPVVGFSHWLWALKLIFLGLLLMQLSAPWIALLGTLIRGIGSYMALISLICIIIAVYTIFVMSDSPPQLDFLPIWLNPQAAWYAIVGWTVGTATSHLGKVFLVIIGFGIAEVLVFMGAFPALARRCASHTSKAQNSKSIFGIGG